jgi:O-methyltransferase involved in polyketide biosynthesis
LQNFLNSSKELKQIFNLGAGFDATFFRLKSQNKLEQTLFIEIDFPDVVKRKLNLIKSNERLFEMCPDLTQIATVNESVGKS